VGVGSVFWFELIEANETLLPVDSTDIEDKPQTKQRRKTKLHTLLYVEDNPANLTLVEQILSRYSDLKLITAITGKSGVETAKSSQPDVILMDINLPDFNGFEALKRLHLDPATSNIPVMALSASAMPRDIKKGLEAGFFRYITKPIKVNEFIASLDLALEFADHRFENKKKS